MASTLPEVVPNRDAPEVCVSTDPEAFPKAPDYEGLQVVGSEVVAKSGKSGGRVRWKGAPWKRASASSAPGAICGLKRSVFWLVAVVAVAVVVIGVLGGVLGSVLTSRGQQPASNE